MLRLPDPASTIHAKGLVVWNFDIGKGTARVVPGSGIKLVEIDPEDRARLQAYIERLEHPVGAQSAGQPHTAPPSQNPPREI